MNYLLLPFRALWNFMILAIIIGLFVAWWGFLFGSVLAVVIMIIFAPRLLLLPAELGVFMTQMWPYQPENN